MKVNKKCDQLLFVCMKEYFDLLGAMAKAAPPFIACSMLGAKFSHYHKHIASI